MPLTLPDDANVGDPGHIIDHNLLKNAMLVLEQSAANYLLNSDILAGTNITVTPGAGNTVIIAAAGAGGDTSPIINVKNAPFGAVGNGTADDTAAIQSALNSVSTGGEVYLPAGRYKITSPLQVTAGSIMIRGAGVGNQIIGSQTGNGSRIEVGTGFVGSAALWIQRQPDTSLTPVFGVTLKDFSIEGQALAGPVDGIWLRSNEATVDHVYVARMSGDGIKVQGYTAWDTYNTRIVNSQIRNNAGAGMHFVSGSADSLMYGCVVFDNNYNVLIDGGSSHQINNCHFYNATTNNIFFNGNGSRSKITNCKIEGAGEHGINIDSTVGGYSDIQIIGNGIHNNGDTTDNTYDNIILQGPSGNGTVRTQMVGNSIGWKTGGGNKPRYGINFATSASQFAQVVGNSFGPASHFGTAPINGTGSGSSPAVIRSNQGYITENNGTATVLSSTSTLVVSHGLHVTPGLSDISLTATNSLGSATKYWVSSATSTTFTINLNTTLGGAETATFSWFVSVLP